MNNLDPKILGKIILLQTTIHVLDNNKDLSKFISKGLSEIPGIHFIHVYLNGEIYPVSQKSSALIENCKKLIDYYDINKQKKHINNNENLSFLKKDDTEYFTVSTVGNLYGYLIIEFSNKDQFYLYKPYIENAMNIVALVLENISQKNELLLHKDNLEKTVESRTENLDQTQKKLLKVSYEKEDLNIELIRKNNDLEAILEEKDILIKEIHHRVKNNMQIISSMLELQSEYIHDDRDRDLFVNSKNRILSMSMVHEMLYQSSSLSKINFTKYINELTPVLIQSYNISKIIDLKISEDDIYLTIDVAIPCGLIVNELISNSIKYAFVDKDSGLLSIDIKNKRTAYSITISDDGIGFPDNVDFRNSESLGLKIVTALVSQLNGTIDLFVKNGTTFLIKFKAF